jgi:hypothetical protein
LVIIVNGISGWIQSVTGLERTSLCERIRTTVDPCHS